MHSYDACFVLGVLQGESSLKDVNSNHSRPSKTTPGMVFQKANVSTNGDVKPTLKTSGSSSKRRQQVEDTLDNVDSRASRLKTSGNSVVTVGGASRRQIQSITHSKGMPLTTEL